MTKNAKTFLSVIKIALPLTATLLWLGFIFGNSLQTGTESGETSGRVHTLINALPELLGLGSPISHHFVRKAAHFTEFAILAALVCTDLCCLHVTSLSSPIRRSLPICQIGFCLQGCTTLGNHIHPQTGNLIYSHGRTSCTAFSILYFPSFV